MLGRAEVAVGDPQVTRTDHGQEVVGHRPLLGMAVLAGYDIADQHPLGIEHHQGVTGQGPGAGEPEGLDPVLGAGQVVAVEDLDPIAFQPRLIPAAKLVDDGAEDRAGVLDQGGAGGRLDPVDLVVNGFLGDPQEGGHLLEGRVDRGSDAADDEAHQVNDVREQEVARVLQLGVTREQGIDRGGRQGVLQEGLHHDAHRGILDEPLKDITMDHRCLLAWKSLTPCEATAYQNV